MFNGPLISHGRQTGGRRRTDESALPFIWPAALPAGESDPNSTAQNEMLSSQRRHHTIATDAPAALTRCPDICKRGRALTE